jgi:hypothetical protein
MPTTLPAEFANGILEGLHGPQRGNGIPANAAATTEIRDHFVPFHLFH